MKCRSEGREREGRVTRDANDETRNVVGIGRGQKVCGFQQLRRPAGYDAEFLLVFSCALPQNTLQDGHAHCHGEIAAASGAISAKFGTLFDRQLAGKDQHVGQARPRFRKVRVSLRES